MQNAISTADDGKTEDKAADKTAALESAITAFNQATTPNLDTLNAKIDQARLIAQNGKSGSDWTALQNAISTADDGKTEDKATDKTAALESAITAFNNALTPNLNALNQKIAEAKLIAQDGKSGSDWTALQNAISTADAGKTEDTAADKTTALGLAITAFNNALTPNLNTLNQKIAEARLIAQDGKSGSDWTALQNAISTADAGKTEDTAADKTTALGLAITAFNNALTPNLNALNQKIAEAKLIAQDGKSGSDWTALQTAISTADAGKTEDTAADKTTALALAITAFNQATTPNLDTLNAKIAQARLIAQDGKSGSDWTALQTAISTAETGKTEDTAADKTTALGLAITAFNNALTPNLNTLNQKIAEAKLIAQDGKSGSDWTALQTAISTADADKTEDTAADKTTALGLAITAFNNALTPNLNTLNQKIAEARLIDQAGKSGSDWTALQNAISTADAGKTEDTAADKTAALESAITAFNQATTPNLDTLNQKIAEAKLIAQDGKSGSDWTALQNAISTADAGKTEDTAADKTTALGLAITAFNNALTPNLNTLNQKIAEARLIAQDGKSGSDWTALQTAISTADAGKTEDKAADKTTALESAITAFNNALTPNLNTLNQKIAEAKLIAQDGKSGSDWTALQNAISTADAGKTEDTAADKTTALGLAITAFNNALTPNLNTLNQKIAEAKLIAQDGKSGSDWTALQNAISTADAGKTEDTAADKTTALGLAITAFNNALTPNLNALNQKIAEAKLIAQDGKSGSDWTALQTAISTADAGKTEDTAADKTTALGLAITAFNNALTPNLNTLNQKIAEAKLIAQDGKSGSDWTALQTAISTADAGKTEDTAADKTTALGLAITAFNNALTPNLNALNQKIAEAKLIAQDGKSGSDWTALQNAISTADAGKTEDTAADKTTALGLAITAFNNALTPNLNTLNQKIAEARLIAQDGKSGSDWTALQNAISTADAGKTEDTAADKTTALESAITAFNNALTPNLNALNQKIAEARLIAQDGKSGSDWTALQTAISTADTGKTEDTAADKTTALGLAITAFNNALTPNLNTLNQKIADARLIDQAGKSGSDWTALQTAISTADAGKTEDTAADKTTALGLAITAFNNALTPNLNALNQKIAEARLIAQDGKSGSDWTALQTAISTADAGKTEDTAADKTTALGLAITAFNNALTPNLNTLNQKIAEVRLIAQAGKSGSDWTALQNAISTADTGKTEDTAADKTTALGLAITAFNNALTPNLNTLNQKIAEAKLIAQDGKSGSDWTALQTAISTADAGKTEDTAADKTTALGLAITAFNNALTPNLNALNQKIAEAKLIAQDGKSGSDWTALQNAISTADAGKTEDTAADKTTALGLAITAFNNALTPNLNTLNQKIAEARLIAQDGKSGSDWTALQNAISTADAGKTEDTAADKTTALGLAITAFNNALTPNLNALNQKIIEAKAIVQADKSLVAWNDLQAAIRIAELVITEDGAAANSAETINTLQLAINTFNASPNQPNLNALILKIAQAKNIQKNLKTTFEFNALQEAITIAENSNTEETALAARNQLESAITTFNNSLDATPSDYLEDEIENAKKIVRGTKTLAAFNVLQEAITQAEDVLVNGNLVETIDGRVDLTNAIETFNSSPDQTNVQTLIEKIVTAKLIVKGNKTADAYTTLFDVIYEIENNIEDDMTEETALEQIETLKQAILAFNTSPDVIL
ncbi:beta strand repeat-containing protein [Williamsoniiplasma luminosum]|uniref:Uncharacterized protein n=1 Tax=Williamsoniiplasma luminosum TaxID=214888 RepID=A0A2S0NK70_9MOLU|nr:hypothetical protein [Williamsoniiplasma luminosum]AVP49408.1 MAG: hypothetical protein C5T88_02370 [Williamsoniiplasma luminosum]